MDAHGLKDAVKREIDARREELVALSRRIHDNPELGFHEYQASAWLTEYLQANGFQVAKGIAQLETAFKATYGQGKPAIVFLAEFDALPKLGHACGHNLIAGSAVGAAIAGKLVVDKLGGTVVVMGTPAEELWSAKAIMVDRGAFQGLDAAMIVHPGVDNCAYARSLARNGIEVEYFGHAAHAASRPEDGINALDAMIIAINAINALRQQIKDKARIHGIITSGGSAANVIPDYTSARFLVRAEDNEYLDNLRERVLHCFEAGALATGCRLEYKWADVRAAAMQTNSVLADAFAENLVSLGREVMPLDPNTSLGTTDTGNVSLVIPTIHPRTAIAPPHVAGHSPEFREAATSEAGWQGMLDGAKAMAMTLVDLLTDKDLLPKVQAEFKQKAK